MKQDLEKLEKRNQEHQNSFYFSNIFKEEEDQLIEKKMILSKSSYSTSERKEDSKRGGESSEYTKLNTLKNIEQKAKELFSRNLYFQSANVLTSLHSKGLGTASTYSLLASAYHQQNHFKLALENYKKALELDPSYEEALWNLSLLRLDLGDYERGYNVFHRARHCSYLHKEDQWRQFISEQHLKVAKAYYDKGYYHEALLELLKSNPHTNEDPPLSIHLQLIKCLWNLDRKREAIEKLLLLRKKLPRCLEVSFLLGNYYYKSKKMTLAIHEWERILKLDPHNKKAMELLSQTQTSYNFKEEYNA